MISDYVYDEDEVAYKPVNSMESMNAIAYSEYTAVNTPLTTQVKAAFPDGTLLSETATVMQCVGIEFYIRSGSGAYIRYTEGRMLVNDVY